LARRAKPTVSTDCREWALQWDWKTIWPSWHDWLLEKPVEEPQDIVDVLKETT